MNIKELINLMTSQNAELTDGNNFYKLFPSKQNGIILAKKSYGSTKYITDFKENDIQTDITKVRKVNKEDLQKHHEIIRKNKLTLNY